MISCARRHLYVVSLYTTLFLISPDPPNLISWVNFGLFAAWISGYRPTLYFTLYCIKYRLSLQVLIDSQMCSEPVLILKIASNGMSSNEISGLTVNNIFQKHFNYSTLPYQMSARCSQDN